MTITDERALAVREDSDLSLSMVVTAEEMKQRRQELQEYVRDYLVEGEDFGVIPGTPKPTLYKPGAEKLCDVYGLQRLVRVTERVEDWESGFFHYEVQADLVSMRTGITIAQGVGSCNSKEARYRWRTMARTCPHCGKETIIKGKAEFGGGWICWKKEGKSDGCGAKFDDDATAITAQVAGKVENDDPYTMVNTFLKMAKKRAMVDAVLSATRSSGIFTQDVEDFVDGSYREVEATPAPKPTNGAQHRAPAPNAADDEATARSAFWAQANELKVNRVEVHKFFGVGTGKGELLTYVNGRVRAAGSAALVWRRMRDQLTKAVEHDKLLAGVGAFEAPETVADADKGDPADIPFE